GIAGGEQTDRGGDGGRGDDAGEHGVVPLVVAWASPAERRGRVVWANVEAPRRSGRGERSARTEGADALGYVRQTQRRAWGRTRGARGAPRSGAVKPAAGEAGGVGSPISSAGRKASRWVGR